MITHVLRLKIQNFYRGELSIHIHKLFVFILLFTLSNVTLFSSLLSSQLSLKEQKIYKVGKKHHTLISICGAVGTLGGAYALIKSAKRGDYKGMVATGMGTAVAFSCFFSPSWIDSIKNVFAITKIKNTSQPISSTRDEESNSDDNDDDNEEGDSSKNNKKKALVKEIENNLNTYLDLRSLAQIMNKQKRYQEYVDFSSSKQDSAYSCSLSYFQLKDANEDLRSRKTTEKKNKSKTESIGIAGVCSFNFNTLLNQIAIDSSNLVKQKNRNRINKLPLIFSFLLSSSSFRGYTQKNIIENVKNTTLREAMIKGYQYLTPFISKEFNQSVTSYGFDQSKLNFINASSSSTKKSSEARTA